MATLQIIEEHHTPDGLLTFLVKRCNDGDVCLGFDGFAWHTHAEILVWKSGLSEDEAVRKFVDDLVGSHAIIAIARVGVRIRDVWVSDIATPDKYKPDDEIIEFRYWDGSLVA